MESESSSRKQRLLRALKSRYLPALQGGNRKELHSIVHEALTSQLTPAEIYLELVVASQERMELLAEAGQVEIALENQASQLTIDLLHIVRDVLQPVAALPFCAVVTCVENELHPLGSRVAADFLYLDGWDTHYLGAGTPASSLSTFCRQINAHILALSVTSESSLNQLNETIAAVREASPNTRIVVGGRALSPGASSQANSTYSDIRELSQVARSLVGIEPGAKLNSVESCVEASLKLIGSRVQTLRRERALSQLELAEAARLDRAYISTVENGKQNPTIGSLVRIAHALGASLDELICSPTHVTAPPLDIRKRHNANLS